MLSFYEKLAEKLNTGTDDPPAGGPSASAAQKKSVSFNANGERTSPKPAGQPAVAAPANDPPPPDGTEPLSIDLFQSDARMIIYVQMSGVAAEDFDLTADEESNTVVIQATQKRPELPLIKKEGEPDEKGHYAKQEIKWNSLYRKVYLPASFDSGLTEAYLKRGVLVVVLPAKKPGVGKKLSVKEMPDEK